VPNTDVQSLNAAALKALAAGDFASAIEQLRRALALEPRNMMVLLNLAAGLRESGDVAAAIATVDQALVYEPRSFRALLMKGSLLDGNGQLKEAAVVYGRAIAAAPPRDRMDVPTQHAMARAWEINRRFTLEIREQVIADLAEVSTQATPDERQRAAAFLDVVLGFKRTYQQQPTHFHYPGMPAIEFYSRDEFPWLAELEAGTPKVLSELREVLDGDEGFKPYVDYPEGTPLDQWRELNGSRRWSAFHFYYQGQRFENNCRRCPQTVALLECAGQPRVTNHMPAAMFSVLQPRTRLPAHTGIANVRLVVHLPLIVPPGCGFRVGNQIREWRVGEAFVFDDTIEHEAWNDSDSTRVVLIFDVWSPRLSLAERALITQVMESVDRMVPKRVGMQL
jgi:aspartate beta-hydroxylase